MTTATEIPLGLCVCGCGLPTSVAKMTNARYGHVKGQPVRFAVGHTRRARNVPACGYVVEDRGHTTPCWVWKLSVTRDGYGQVGHDGRVTLVHIVMWTDRNGPVPNGTELDHLCRVPACCNPDHLEAVTHAENNRRGKNAKLTATQVREIRASLARGARQADVADAYGMSRSAISHIARGATWVAA